MKSIKERSIDLNYSIDRLKQDRFIRHEEEQNKRLQDNLSLEQTMSEKKDEYIENLEDKLNKKQEIIQGYKSEVHQLIDFFENYFIKDIALKILIKNNEQINDQQINDKISMIVNNNKTRKQVKKDFHGVLDQVFYDKKKYNEINLNTEEYSSDINKENFDSENRDFGLKKEDRLKKSRKFLRKQLIKNEAYENTIAEMRKKWNKNEEVISFDSLKKIFEEKIIELTNDQNFLNSLEEKIKKTVDEKDDKKAKMNKM